MLNLGKAIKLVRVGLGKSLAQVAKQSGVGVAFLSLVESGERQPSLSTLKRISEALNIPSELFIILGQHGSSSLRSDDARVGSLVDALRRVEAAQADLKRRLESGTK
jgi:XRE family transcriptional regulator, master regulator for biofilm formation